MRGFALTTTAAVFCLAGCSMTPEQEPLSETDMTAEAISEEARLAMIEPELSDSGILTDKRDGTRYKTAVINGKRWMAENLNYRTNSYLCYNVTRSNCDKYGKLYDWETAMTACPQGWRLSTKKDWDDLIEAIGGARTAGRMLKSKSGWEDDRLKIARNDDIGGNGVDIVGFSALPGGFYTGSLGSYGIGWRGCWWTTTSKYWRGDPYVRCVDIDNDKTYGYSSYKRDKYSVRCLQGAHDGSDKSSNWISVINEEETQDENKLLNAAVKKEAERLEAEKRRIAEQKKKDAEQWEMKRRLAAEQDEKRTEQRRKKALSSVGKSVGSLIDLRDGRKYRTVKIGESRWMAENLNYLPPTGRSWCYDYDTSNCRKFGRLYDWYTAKTVCPDGWHLPTRWAWRNLAEAASSVAAYDGDILKARTGWVNKDDTTPGDGTDVLGFSALPGGYRTSGGFKDADINGNWWAATDFDVDLAYGWYVSREYDRPRPLGWELNYKTYGLSVRCRADSMEIGYGTLIDKRDGQKYVTIKIDTQIWMAQNLNYRPQEGRSWCNDNHDYHCEEYGRLYDWNTAATACPAGWHLPSRAEWDILGQAVDGERLSKKDGTVDWLGMGEKLKMKSGWNARNYWWAGVGSYYELSGNGTDEYRFSALPGGRRDSDGEFGYPGKYGYWWMADEYNGAKAYGRRISSFFDQMEEDYYNKKDGNSVRCLKDSRNARN